MGALLYSIQVRAREIGIRMALGAEPHAVRRSLVRRALALVSVGLTVGTAMGIVAGHAISHQLFDVRPMDAWSVAAVAAALFALAWLAALMPAARASAIEPAIALRHD
jgi:ABC-type antimicrobial peptide transport system permease subunit